MFTTADVAAASGVEKATIRSWLARAPGFRLGEYRGAAKAYSKLDAMTLIIAGELIGASLGSPYELLPLASRISRMTGTVWISRDRDGALAVSNSQPDDVAVALPLQVLASRLRQGGGQRIARTTR